ADPSATTFVQLYDVTTIDGGSGNDTIHGTSGDDSIFGGNGNDAIYGHGGDDYLDGGAGVDQIFGGDGIDSILGGLGQDTLTGSGGLDVFRFDYSTTDRNELDIIADYSDDTLQVIGYGGDYDAILFDETTGDLTLGSSGKDIQLTGVTTKPASSKFRFF
ncbi:MAG: calcium-binding protein, partial [Planctomycetota bacterium]